jgi:hypothetical protein
MSEQEFAVALAKRVNVELNIPFLDEAQEGELILWTVQKLAPLIPESIRDFVMNAADGIDSSELGRLEDVLVSVLNQYVDIPLLPESAEAALIRPVVQAVLDLAKQGLSLDQPSEI